MRCTEVQKQLNRFHDAELPPDLRETVERHLTTCAPCRAALANLEGVAELWAGLEHAPVPAGFAEHVMLAARLRNARRPAGPVVWLAFRSWWWEQSLAMRAAAAAVVVAASVAGVLLSGNLSLRSGSAGTRVSANAALDVGEQIGSLSVAPEGSLEQTYLAWTASAGLSQKQP